MCYTHCIIGCYSCGHSHQLSREMATCKVTKTLGGCGSLDMPTVTTRMEVRSVCFPCWGIEWDLKEAREAGHNQRL